MRQKSLFVCQNCGYRSPKWVGRCPQCGQWNSLVETLVEVKGKKSRGRSSPPLKAVNAGQLRKTPLKRIKTNLDELNRVLGGGLVPGQTILFAGEPGIGKSTLLTQLAAGMAQRKEIAYLCGEESPEQVNLRLERVAPSTKTKGKIELLPSTDVDQVINWLENSSPPLLLIIDSIQTLTTAELSGVAGSIGQVRETAQRLIRWAKKNQTPLLLVGHVTKKGVVAGPKVLEHAVDTVIYFEGERSADLRILRTVKNRFGPTDEIGVFQMKENGLQPIALEKLTQKIISGQGRAGSALTIVAEGKRMMAVEIQALVSQSFTPFPKRIITGLSQNRTQMLIAVVQKQLHLPLFKYDVFVNVAQGVKISEPAADLAVCAAVFSSYQNQPLPASSGFIGEVSLLGEVGEVPQREKRKKYGRSLGMKTIFDQANLFQLKELRKIVSRK